PEVVYCVMEFLQGRTLGDELDAGPMRLERGVRIVEQLADALAAAHRVGVVHRDVKPDNIMLIERGGSKDYVKVLDFGVAKLTHTDGKAMVSTTEGAIIGTPICMSPEQAQGDDIDARSDVWAVGVILYRMLTGAFPFDAATFVSIAVQIITKPYAPLPSKTVAGEVVPQRLARLVEKCLQKRRDLRPSSMAEVRDELRAILRNDDVEKPRRSPLPMLVAALAVLGVAGGGAFWKLSAHDPKPPPPLVVPPPVLPTVEDAAVVVVDAGEPADAGEVVVDAGVAEVEAVDAGAAVKPKPAARKPVPLSVDLLLSQLKDLRPKINGCGARYASERALVVGTEVKLRFEIQKSGKLTNVTLAPPVQGGALQKCVAGVLAQNPFPPNDGNPKFSKPSLGVRFTE
ncbi:MAG: serine/threonine protein kinase, partial [Archangium sp.]|nr:serine/threonine protein kinase [Archangium sp.]